MFVYQSIHPFLNKYSNNIHKRYLFMKIHLIFCRISKKHVIDIKDLSHFLKHAFRLKIFLKLSLKNLLNCTCRKKDSINTKKLLLPKKLKFCPKLKFSNSLNFETWRFIPLIFQIWIIWSNRIHSLKYLTSTTSILLSLN